MMPLLYNVHDVAVLECARDGKKIMDENDAVEIIGAAFERGAALVAIPVERFDPAFFRLGTGVAGAIIQKFVNYRKRLAVIGDISAYLAGSSALRDFVTESNRGDFVWFLSDSAELDQRLGARSTASEAD